jgi:hypothetical protein
MYIRNCYIFDKCKLYVKFPGKLVTCISYENYVYRTKSDWWKVHSCWFFFFLFDIFDWFVLFYNKIEDEEHFILEWTINSKLRTDLFAILANENPNFMQFSSEQKLIYLLNPATTAHVNLLINSFSDFTSFKF